MNLEEIKKAVDEEKTVHYEDGFVTKTNQGKEEYYITFDNGCHWSLTNEDGTLNGKEKDFYIGDKFKVGKNQLEGYYQKSGKDKPTKELVVLPEGWYHKDKDTYITPLTDNDIKKIITPDNHRYLKVRTTLSEKKQQLKELKKIEQEIIMECNIKEKKIKSGELITREKFLANTNEDELFCTIGSFLCRYEKYNKNFTVLDEHLYKICKQMLNDFKVN